VIAAWQNLLPFEVNVNVSGCLAVAAVFLGIIELSYLGFGVGLILISVGAVLAWAVGRHNSHPRFAVGQQVILTRDLPTQRANSEGSILGVTPTPDGVNYAIRFNNGMRIVHEHDLRSATTTPPEPTA
jgi:hypothetical protein